jgi:hypothetical protein
MRLYDISAYGGFQPRWGCVTTYVRVGWNEKCEIRNSAERRKGALSSLNSGNITAETRRSAEVHREIKREGILMEKAEDAEDQCSFALLAAQDVGKDVNLVARVGPCSYNCVPGGRHVPR